MRFQPLHDRVLVRRLEAATMTKGGLLYVPTVAQEKLNQGTVVAIGEGKPLPDGTNRPIPVAIGDVVLFGKFCGSEVEVDEEKFILLLEDEVYGIMHPLPAIEASGPAIILEDDTLTPDAVADVP